MKNKVLCICLNAIGHTNAVAGIAKILSDAGNEIIFCVDETWKNKFKKLGYGEVYFSDSDETSKPNEVNKKYMEKIIGNLGCDPLESYKLTMEGFKGLFDKEERFTEQFEKIISEVKPDALLVDFLASEAFIKFNIPYINIFSCNPLIIPKNYHMAPPAFSGFSTEKNENENWEEFYRKKLEITNFFLPKLKSKLDKLKSMGAKVEDYSCGFLTSNDLNIYNYIRELDYTDIRPLDDTYQIIEGCFRDEKKMNEQTFTLPQHFNNLPGKLIYVSMGSLGCFDLGLMTKVIKCINDSNHKFIVSGGATHLVELQKIASKNVHVLEFVPQLEVINLSDLVITHGGNNSFTEIITSGKPSIVMPLFADQYDNATRVQEKNFGSKIRVPELNRNLLLETIEKVLNDQEIISNCKKVAERLKMDNTSSKEFLKKFDKLMKKYKNNNTH